MLGSPKVKSNKTCYERYLIWIELLPQCYKCWYTYGLIVNVTWDTIIIFFTFKGLKYLQLETDKLHSTLQTLIVRLFYVNWSIFRILAFFNNKITWLLLLIIGILDFAYWNNPKIDCFVFLCYLNFT